MENEDKQVIKIRDFDNDKRRVLVYGKANFKLKDDIISDVNINIDSFIMSNRLNGYLDKCYTLNRNIQNCSKKFEKQSDVSSLIEDIVD